MTKAIMQFLSGAILLAMAIPYFIILPFGLLVTWLLPTAILWIYRRRPHWRKALIAIVMAVIIALYLPAGLFAAGIWLVNACTILISKASRYSRVEEPYFPSSKR